MPELSMKYLVRHRFLTRLKIDYPHLLLFRLFASGIYYVQIVYIWYHIFICVVMCGNLTICLVARFPFYKMWD
jgi:hypothetical protein